MMIALKFPNNFVSSLAKAIAGYRDVDDGETFHTLTVDGNRSRCSGHVPRDANNMLEMKVHSMKPSERVLLKLYKMGIHAQIICVRRILLLPKFAT